MRKVIKQPFENLVILCILQIPFLKYCNAVGNDELNWKNESLLRHRLAQSEQFGYGSTRLPRSLHHFTVNETYDWETTPPKVNGSGVPVKFTVTIYSVREIIEIHQEITIEMRLQLWWLDSRLDEWKLHLEGKKYVSITREVDALLWHPDIYIDFVKEIVQPTLLGTYATSLRYYKNGFLRKSARITIRMACPMAFYYYPVDQQECNVDMKSYAFTNDVLELQWDTGKNNLVLMKPGLDLPNFAVGLENPTAPALQTGSGNYYSSVRFTVLLRRKLAYHFIQTYLPSTVFVVISWLSFLVPPESVPGRMAICMTTLLSLATMFGGIRQSIPKVSYPKALDIWMVACIFFAFLTLVEYTMTALIPKETGKCSTVCSASQRNVKNIIVVKKAADGSEHSTAVKLVTPSHLSYADLVRIGESYTWIVVIAMFAIFNLIYWPWLLVSSGYYSKFGEDLFYKSANAATN